MGSNQSFRIDGSDLLSKDREFFFPFKYETWRPCIYCPIWLKTKSSGPRVIRPMVGGKLAQTFPCLQSPNNLFHPFNTEIEHQSLLYFMFCISWNFLEASNPAHGDQIPRPRRLLPTALEKEPSSWQFIWRSGSIPASQDRDPQSTMNDVSLEF